MSLTFLFRYLALALVCTACAARGTGLETLTPEQLFERGTMTFSQGKWTDAAQAFERFTLQYPTHPRLQEARFRLADTFFGKKEYISAASEFARLAADYPAGPWADDAQFKVCESYTRLSPKPPLDQQYTRAALDHCQALESAYPNSEFVGRSKELATEMLNRLAEKEFMAGDFYFKRKGWDSAIMSYERVLREFPATPVAPRSLLRLYQSYINVGYKEEAEAAKARLLKDYPESEAARSLKATAVAEPS